MRARFYLTLITFFFLVLRGCVSVAVDAVHASPSHGVHLMMPGECRWSHAAPSLMSCPLKLNWGSPGCHCSSSPRLRTTWSLQASRQRRWQGAGRCLWEGLHEAGSSLEPPSPCSSREQMGREKETREPYMAFGTGSLWCALLKIDEPIRKSTRRRVRHHLCTSCAT